MDTRKIPKHDHAWRGTWERPLHVDEDDFDPLTIARMTDHNVRGTDKEAHKEELPYLKEMGIADWEPFHVSPKI